MNTPNDFVHFLAISHSFQVQNKYCLDGKLNEVFIVDGAMIFSPFRYVLDNNLIDIEILKVVRRSKRH